MPLDEGGRVIIIQEPETAPGAGSSPCLVEPRLQSQGVVGVTVSDGDTCNNALISSPIGDCRNCYWKSRLGIVATVTVITGSKPAILRNPLL
jgi:hypothetical protein